MLRIAFAAIGNMAPFDEHPDVPLILQPLLQVLASPALHAYLFQSDTHPMPPGTPPPFQTRMTVHRAATPATAPSPVFSATYLFNPHHTIPPLTYGTALLLATEAHDGPTLPPTRTSQTLHLALRFIHDASTRAFLAIAPLPPPHGFLVQYSRQDTSKQPAYIYRALFHPSLATAYTPHDAVRALRIYLLTRQSPDDQIPHGISYLAKLAHARHSTDTRLFLSSVSAEFGLRNGHTVRAAWTDGIQLWRRTLGSATLRFEREQDTAVGTRVVGWALGEFRRRRVEDARAQLVARVRADERVREDRKREQRRERNRQAAKRSWERKKERERAMLIDVEKGRARVEQLRLRETQLRNDNLRLRHMIKHSQFSSHASTTTHPTSYL